VPSLSNSVGVFCGDFTKGPVDAYLLITSVDDLIDYYGKPTNTNYNQWFQAYNFLQYGNSLLVSRAANIIGKGTVVDGCIYIGCDTNDNKIVELSNVGTVVNPIFTVGQLISFASDNKFYEIVSIDYVNNKITLNIEVSTVYVSGNVVNLWSHAMNGVIEAANAEYTTSVQVGSYNVNVPNNVTSNDYDYVKDLIVVKNYSDYESIEDELAFSGAANSKLKFVTRNPGTWANDLQICIANTSSFLANAANRANHLTRYAFEGIVIDDLFEYAPTDTEIAVIIKYKTEIVEIFTVDLDPLAKDYNNKSSYIETVINSSSKYVYVKDNTSVASVADYTLVYNNTNSTYVGKTLTFKYAADSSISEGDLLTAYELFSNKEDIDIDIVIANELDNGVSARNLVDTRADCIGFIGANHSDLVGQKSAIAVSNLIEWRKNGALDYNDMFIVACGNYKYQYDRYNDKYRWVNIAGDIGGLRAQTNSNRASWWASAGLERGQIQNAIKLAFNPTQGQRDMLYKNGINPICSFTGQGIVMWGQKTLLDKPSSFDRVNTRGLFNTLERALGKMAKYQVMEFNDNFTRNRIVSMIKPYLTTVQAGRGIQDFLVICDESNNTADIISRNQLIVDIYVKPTYVAEFIQLRFTNAGTNSFADIIGG